jgi:conjugative transfer signal peptidase TraF
VGAWGKGGGDAQGGTMTGRRRAGLLVVFAVIGFAVAGALRLTGVRVNLSPSAPIGLFLASRADTGTRFQRGMLVAVCLPLGVARFGRGRRYLMRGSCSDGTAPVGKSIFAIAGDTVVVSDAGLALNGSEIHQTRRLARDTQGRAIPKIASGVYAVAAREIWLISTQTAKSWDSRYFGPVPTSGVAETLRPLWAIRPGSKFDTEPPPSTEGTRR